MNTAVDIRTFQGPEFESFLRERLCLRVEQSPRNRDKLCNFESAGVAFGDSYLDSLVNLYEWLPDPAKAQFHRGLVSLFRCAEPDQFTNQGMHDLIYLIGMTRSYVGLEALAPVLGTGAWGEMFPGLIYDALSVFKMFPTSDRTYEAARDLATSSNFKDRYVFEAYSVLIASNPRAWLNDLMLLNGRFNRLIQRIEQQRDPTALAKLAANRKRLAGRMGKLPLASLADHLNGLNPTMPVAGQLLRSLLGTDGPLAIEKIETVEEVDEASYEIVDRRDEARRTSVAIGPRILLAMTKWRLIGQRNPGLRAFIGKGSIYVSAVQRKLDKIDPAHQAGMATASEAM